MKAKTINEYQFERKINPKEAMGTGAYVDKNGVTLKIFDEVDVPYPNDDEMHNNEFRGTVMALKDGYVMVIDMDDNFFNIKPERLEIVNE
mgnify:CR=1 FL=1